MATFKFSRFPIEIADIKDVGPGIDTIAYRLEPGTKTAETQDVPARLKPENWQSREKRACKGPENTTPPYPWACKPRKRKQDPKNDLGRCRMKTYAGISGLGVRGGRQFRETPLRECTKVLTKKSRQKQRRPGCQGVWQQNLQGFVLHNARPGSVRSEKAVRLANTGGPGEAGEAATMLARNRQVRLEPRSPSKTEKYLQIKKRVFMK